MYDNDNIGFFIFFITIITIIIITEYTNSETRLATKRQTFIVHDRRWFYVRKKK